jgi:hypothetical protein
MDLSSWPLRVAAAGLLALTLLAGTTAVATAGPAPRPMTIHAVAPSALSTGGRMGAPAHASRAAPRSPGVISAPWPPNKVPPAFKSVHWDRATLPGAVCGASAPIKLAHGTADIKSSRWVGTVVVGLAEVRYGDLTGHGPDQVALNIWCTTTSGTADGQLADSWVIFTAGSTGPQEIGILVPQQPFSPVTPHVPYFSQSAGAIAIQVGHITVHELWYGPVDATCCPSGQATTVWDYVNGRVRLSTVTITAPYAPLPKSVGYPVAPLPAGTAASATLVALDTATGVGEFYINCGWDVKTDKEFTQTFAKVQLRLDSFGLETDLAHPARGQVEDVAFAQWASYTKEHGWAGLLYLNQRPAWVTNGPGTDVCHGHL